MCRVTSSAMRPSPSQRSATASTTTATARWMTAWRPAAGPWEPPALAAWRSESARRELKRARATGAGGLARASSSLRPRCATGKTTTATGCSTTWPIRERPAATTKESASGAPTRASTAWSPARESGDRCRRPATVWTTTATGAPTRATPGGGSPAARTRGRAGRARSPVSRARCAASARSCPLRSDVTASTTTAMGRPTTSRGTSAPSALLGARGAAPRAACAARRAASCASRSSIPSRSAATGKTTTATAWLTRALGEETPAPSGAGPASGTGSWSARPTGRALCATRSPGPRAPNSAGRGWTKTATERSTKASSWGPPAPRGEGSAGERARWSAARTGWRRSATRSRGRPPPSCVAPAPTRTATGRSTKASR